MALSWFAAFISAKQNPALHRPHTRTCLSPTLVLDTPLDAHAAYSPWSPPQTLLPITLLPLSSTPLPSLNFAQQLSSFNCGTRIQTLVVLSWHSAHTSKSGSWSSKVDDIHLHIIQCVALPFCFFFCVHNEVLFLIKPKGLEWNIYIKGWSLGWEYRFISQGGK